MLIWKNFERHSWPSIVVVAPTGAPILFTTGEGQRDRLDAFIKAAVAFYKGDLNPAPVDLFFEADAEHEIRH